MKNDRPWQVEHPDERTVETLCAAFGASKLLGEVLAARGLDTPEKAASFLQPEPLSDPFLMADMDKAVERLNRAIETGESVVIFGDYDVDGVTATALLYEQLRDLGLTVRCMLPSRQGEGYGLTKKTLDGLKQKDYSLIVTVDNGIAAVEEAAYARELGMDLIITDHHLPHETLPEALAVIDPHRADDASPFKELCGAGVAFKLCAALGGGAPEDLLEFCGDLAAIGTVADMVPLVGENRTIVQAGLQALQNPGRPGLVALFEEMGLAGKEITADNISYGVAPRLNAAGRMESASLALYLLLEEDYDTALARAEKLLQCNQQRQQIEQEILAQAEAILAQQPALQRDRVIVLWGEDFHLGVIGIVASQLEEKYGRPAILISMQGQEGRASGRSVPGFNLHDAIAACSPLLMRYGGHAMAAGFSIRRENLEAFRQEINAWAAQTDPVRPLQPLQLDVTVRLADLTVEGVTQLQHLAPFGNSNPAPLFLLEDVQLDGIYPIGEGGRHTRVRLRQGEQCLYAAWFGVRVGQLPYALGDHLDVVVALSVYHSEKAGDQLSGRVQAVRPAGLGNDHCEQVALFEALRSGVKLQPEQRCLLRPSREDTIALYRLVQKENVRAEDLQVLFAKVGAQNAGKALASLVALRQLGLVQLVENKQGARFFRAAAVQEKKELSQAPILCALEND